VDFERVIQLDPTVTSAYVNLGIITMQQLKNYRKCVILCSTVLIRRLLCKNAKMQSCMHFSSSIPFYSFFSFLGCVTCKAASCA